MAFRSLSWLVCAAVPLVFAAVQENVYRGELLSFPGAWAFQLPSSAVILTTDEELETLAADPDKPINLSLGRQPEMASLRQVCERAQGRGERTIKLAFDQFFRQYRPGQDRPRRLTPDSAEYVAKIAAVSRFATRYGLGLELSLLSPLEVGSAYQRRTGESGVWAHYRKGVRDPESGAFSVEMWRHQRWVNNKGPVEIQPAGVRVFAFRETPVAGAPYRVVDPKEIVEIREGVDVEVYAGLTRQSGDFRAQRIRVHGRTPTAARGLNRVLAVQLYRTPELDYFSPSALSFLQSLVDQYAAAGVRLNGLYADEMHIQGDWSYFGHHDNGEFALRYLSPGLMRVYAEKYGSEFADLGKYLVYFTYGQEDAAGDLTARQGVQPVFGASPEAIRQTALFRARYYHLLQDTVVDLFTAAKRYAEEKAGYRLEARAHATWAQSPTIDYWETGTQNRHPHMYEYTSNFVWSNTVHQAATACYDYFKWGDFLTGNGNDHAEGGWLDRDYWGLALAASTGMLNDTPNSYAAHWGMPAEIDALRTNLVAAYGDSAPAAFAAVENMGHREVDVLMLYPLDLVASEERFGSWMTQYGYANYISAAKLLERGTVVDGGVMVAGHRYTTLAALFEPFPSARLLQLMRDFVDRGGRLVWSGPPPVITAEGGAALAMWQELFLADYRPQAAEGFAAPGKQVRFEGTLANVPAQMILTDFLPDHVYPVTPRQGAKPVATVGKWVAGTHRALEGGGSATFLGFRPRDDQAASLGYETRTWFETLDALGAYAGPGETERISRSGEILATRFANGAIALAPHLKAMEENWAGGFARDRAADQQALRSNPPPSGAIRLDGFRVLGHTVTYAGTGAVAFRKDAEGRLVAFAGSQCTAFTLDGRRYAFAQTPFEQIAWAPVDSGRTVAGGAVAVLFLRGRGEVRLPAEVLPQGASAVAEGPKPGSRGTTVAIRWQHGDAIIDVTPEISGRTLYVLR